MCQVMSRLIVVVSLFSVVPASAQIFDNPRNLQVLPKDTDAATLRDTMRHFALSTGLRCRHCHAAVEGQPMNQWDFASDEKDLKKKARVMLRMVSEINEKHLGQYGENRVRVQCVTCHRGVSKPRQIGEELDLAARDGGTEALKARYSELREQYYGTHSYDFKAFTLSEVARSFAAEGRLDEAFALLDSLLADEPDDFAAHLAYGELERDRGNPDAALSHLRKALETRPDAEFVARRIAEIEARAAGK